MPISDRWHQLIFKTFKGMNRDVSPEKLPPEFAQMAVNMQIGDSGVPETINGCTVAKDIGADIEGVGYFQTRGEDYLFMYTAGTVKIYKYPSFDVEETLFSSANLSSAPWFAEHNGEFYMGNMEDGIWRWKIGHQSLIRGSAPLDILVQSGGEGEAEKEPLEWWFAYDYEYRGGRSPLSRMARIRLFKDTQKVEITMDTPPDVSKNRRIYASDDEGTTWWMVKEEEDRNVVAVELDSELVDRKTDAYLYNSDAAKAISPQALMGISHDNMLWLAYLVESPTLVQRSQIGQPYFNDTDIYDLLEIPTNMIGYGKNVVVSTVNKIWALRAEVNVQEILVDEGAYRGSMRIWRGALVWVNEKGFRIFDGEKVDTISGINTVDFSGLQKEKRFALWTSQQDFEQGDYDAGVSSDVVPGALSLQYMKPIGVSGWLVRQNNDAYTSPAKKYIWTNRSGYDYYSQPFKIINSVANEITFDSISLFMKEYGSAPDDFTCEIRKEKDSDGKPDMSDDGLIIAVEGGVTDDFKNNMFTFDAEATKEETNYYIVIPNQGVGGGDYQLKYYNPSTTNQKRLYPQGEYLQYSDDGGDTWTNYSANGDNVFLRFKIGGHGKILVTPFRFSDYEGGKLDNSNTYDYAEKFTWTDDCEITRGEILVHTKVGSPAYPTIEIRTDSSGSPSDVVEDTATDFSEVGDLMRFKFSSNSLVNGTDYWAVVNKVGDASNYWEWGTAEKLSGETKSRTTGAWSNISEGMYLKLFAEIASAASYATSGSWTSNKIDFSADADFDKFEKLFVNMMLPGTTADIRVDVETSEGSANDVTLPYDIDAAFSGANWVKVTVDIELGDALYTPTVDSILLFYKRTGDDGDRLHSINLKGAYCLSLEDYDSSGDTEFSYLLSKYGFWYKWDRAFYGYLPIGDDVVLGIGKNSNENYRNLYSLDDSTASSWYVGDSATIPIYTEWGTGWLLYSHVVKLFRKLWPSISGNSGAQINVEGEVKGAERYSDESASYAQSRKLQLHGDDIKSEFISFNPQMQGKYIKLKFYATGVNWKLHDFELAWRDCMRRNIAEPRITNYPYFVFYRSYADTDALYSELINTIDVREDDFRIQQLDTGKTIYSLQVCDSYLYVATTESNDAYLYIYKINSDGSLTLQNSGGYKYSTYSNRQYIVVYGNRVIISAGLYPNVRLYSIDVTDKTSPSIVVTKSLYRKVDDIEILQNMVLVNTTSSVDAGDTEIQYRNPFTLEEVESARATSQVIMAVFPNSDLWVYAVKGGYSLYLMRGITQIKTIDANSKDNFYQLSWNPTNGNLYIISLYDGGGGDYRQYLYVYNQNLDKIESLKLCEYSDNSSKLSAGVFCTVEGYTIIWYGDTTNGWYTTLRKPDDTVVNTLSNNSYNRIAKDGQAHRAGYGKFS